ncbi:active regulator of SIRT1 [Ceratitis capitata]|uniref:active regulator of SIRT1 n=1 Tax=Ceratitis capitata TaxID=7213 RepID=UPI000329FE5D|nr:active regulator of SIRT1 [Ceratitis capitata]
MSLKLLKQSLEILDETAHIDKTAKHHKEQTLAKKHHQPGWKVAKEQRSHQSNSLATKQKRNIEEVRKELKPDKTKTDINLKRLLALSQNTITPAAATKILKRTKKDDKLKKPKKPKELKSIFTEEDFLAFEKEYFPTSS